ncbi:MAG: hypothetical protein P8K10_04585 [Crocinitomicaceae bacterium]|nr:hypothetical protein [Crocinitomicaceae bacterium]
MEEKYIQIFSKSSFQELTNEEKSFISELCSNEEEFESIKHLYSGMETLSNETFRLNSDSVKRQLDQEFKEIHANEGGFRLFSFLFPPIKPLYAKPGLQIAFLLVFVFTLYYSLNNISIDNKPKQLYSQNEVEENEGQEKLKEVSENKTEIEMESTAEELLTESNESTVLVENGTREIVTREIVTMDTEIMSSDLITAEMIGDVEEDSFFDEGILLESPSVPSPTAMAISGLDRAGGIEDKFIIEPIGEDLELLEDLFVTF